MHIHVKEFKSSSFEPTRCYKCQKFHHCVAKLCTNSPRCGHCASDTHIRENCPHINDISKAKCLNCDNSGPQPHSSHSKLCPKYIELKKKLSENMINNGRH